MKILLLIISILLFASCLPFIGVSSASCMFGDRLCGEVCIPIDEPCLAYYTPGNYYGYPHHFYRPYRPYYPHRSHGPHFGHRR